MLYLIQNHPDLSADCRRRGGGQHVAGQTAGGQPRFVRRTYHALEL